MLDKHAPLKQKGLRGNNAPFMNQSLSKAIMIRSKFKNIFNKYPTNRNKSIYNKQRNYCVNLLRREKKKYYNNLDLHIFKDNKTFWQRVKPLFSDKQKGTQRNITIVENNIVITDNGEVAEKLNNFFIEAVDNLKIEPFINPIYGNICSGDIDEIIRKYESHPSILKIKEN